MLKTLHATRYVTPLREGGSLPAIVEADDDGLYVLKFSGAGQGKKVLTAELIAGELARAAGLPMPEIVFLELDADMARTEPDEEIQQLIRESAGLNLGLDYLPGSVNYDPLVEQPDDLLASKIVWFDALIQNVDRTARNTNMLLWHRKLWLIDHGAAFYFHHDWSRAEAASTSRFPQIKDHVLLPLADKLSEADAEMTATLTADVIKRIVGLIPQDWLTDDPQFADPEAHRKAYVDYLIKRLAAPRGFVEQAKQARKDGPPTPRPGRGRRPDWLGRLGS